ncbi:MAG: hypothetical protein KGZ80_03440 [Methylomonas sp.]|nr:hypothetical protein [Methylomonas sp.]
MKSSLPVALPKALMPLFLWPATAFDGIVVAVFSLTIIKTSVLGDLA